MITLDSFSKLSTSWQKHCYVEYEKPYFKKLCTFLREESKNYIIFPESENWFKALEYCDFNAISVVILGQDPYHNDGQADGLCFSVDDTVKIPPSLRNIFQEMSADIGMSIPQTGNLQKWAEQSILLLNATLTVRANKAGSHQNHGWEIFTDSIIQKISFEKHSVVFILWGNYAQKKSVLIDSSKHLILTSAHPSPLSAYKGFFGNQHFSKTNNYLYSIGKKIINW
jgi:uracil-DNA glycosylase